MSSTTTPTTPGEPDSETVLEVEDLSITYRMEDEADVHAVQNVSFSIEPGSTFGLVGESGCGKTTAARALIGLLDDNGEVTNGAIYKDGRDLTAVSDDELRGVRWGEIATIPQNVMNALNPVETVGSQIVDVIQLHTDRSQADAKIHAEDLFDQVGLTPDRLNDYPHEFSGGMLQRAVIAMAMSCDPDLIIADEPTTALDVVVQDEILSKFAELQAEMDVAVLVISHDIGVMAEICDYVGVMYAGELMEVGSAEAVFTNPSNPYTMGLANSFPDITDPDRDLVDIPGTAPELKGEHQGCPFVKRCPFATEECEQYRPELVGVDDTGHHSRCHYVDEVDRLREEAADPETWGGAAGGADGIEPDENTVLEAEGVRKYFDAESGLLDSILGREPTPVKAVDGVSFDVHEGEIFGIVGESGSGKSTLGRTMLDLYSMTEGSISLDGQEIDEIPNEQFRRAAQIIFQDPFESLNPRMTIQQTITEPLALLEESIPYTERVEMARQTLEEVGLSPGEEYLTRFPDQLSGGERQRVSIARALIVDPQFLLADEPVSMLDVSIRASVLNILRRLRRDDGLTISIISHDLSLIRNVSDRTAVMYLGEFVEVGDTDRIVEDPKHPYTKALVSSVPVPDPTIERESADIGGEPPSPRDPPAGCRFHTRCPAVIPPEEFEFGDERFRELMDLRQAVDTGAVRISRAREQSNNPDDPASVAAAIKTRRFDGSFVDPTVEEVVDDALTALADGDDEAAAERLADAFTTPCELDQPELVEVEGGRQVACHLYD